MKATIQTALSAFLLAACATPGTYISPVDQVQIDARKQAERFSAEVANALKTKNEDEVIELGKQALKEILKDPESAQFRNVQLKSYAGGAVICGEVNAKNSYGGYIGAEDFMAGTTFAVLWRTGGRYPEIDWRANSGIREACLQSEPYTKTKK